MYGCTRRHRSINGLGSRRSVELLYFLYWSEPYLVRTASWRWFYNKEVAKNFTLRWENMFLSFVDSTLYPTKYSLFPPLTATQIVMFVAVSAFQSWRVDHEGKCLFPEKPTVDDSSLRICGVHWCSSNAERKTASFDWGSTTSPTLSCRIARTIANITPLTKRFPYPQGFS